MQAEGLVRSGAARCWLVALLVLLFVLPAEAQRRKKARPKKGRPAKGAATRVGVYRSRNFLIHTDLSAQEAKALLAKLERMLRLVSKYYGRRNPRPIECFIVKDLKNWSDSDVRRMTPEGYSQIQAGSGVTALTSVRSGQRFRATARVFAVCKREIPQHECVHAYCGQAFGDTGPTWYSEGMAEVGKYWRDKDASAVHCSDYVAKYLRESKPKELSEIIAPFQVTGDSWQNYSWRWALCHLLGNNPNYSARFRPLGIALMSHRRGVSFRRVYGAMAKEINFEYHFFLKHVEPGFRVDLCSWDWKARYRQPSGSGYLSAKIDAGHGWQPSRLLVKKGMKYQVSASGTWKIAPKGDDLTADGDSEGRGKLVGILFEDYKLSEPFDVGAYGTFTAPSDGNLLLRCRDKWTEIADNKGVMTVRLKRADRGRPLPRPQPAPTGGKK